MPYGPSICDKFNHFFIGEFVIPDWCHEFGPVTLAGDLTNSPIKKITIQSYKKERVGGVYFQSEMDNLKPSTRIKVFGFRLKSRSICTNSEIMKFMDDCGCRYFGINGLILTCELLNEKLCLYPFTWAVSFCGPERNKLNVCGIPRVPIAFKSKDSDRFEIHNGSLSGIWNKNFLFLGFQLY